MELVNRTMHNVPVKLDKEVEGAFRVHTVEQ